MDYHKVQPQAIDIEQAVLGALMLERNAVPVAVQLLNHESFYERKHQYIFKAIEQLNAKGKPVDIVTVTVQLKQMGKVQQAGGALYIADLTDKVASAAHVEHHALIVQQKYMQRQVITKATELIKDAYSELTDPLDLVGKMQAFSLEMSKSVYGNKSSSAADIVRQVQHKIHELYDKPEMLTGVPLGLPTLDRFTGGWQNTDLIIIGGRPGMGKTALALQFARNAAGFGLPVGFFSMEMSKEQLGQRIIQMDAEINSHNLRNPAQKMTPQMLNAASAVEGEDNLYINDSGGMDVAQIAAQAAIWKQEHDIRLIVIDYLQLIGGGSLEKDNVAQTVSAITAAIKNIAKRLNIPIILLSQLNRGVETRGDKRPNMSDLKESGGIEENADIVIFPYRPEYYGITMDADNQSLEGIAEIIFAKYRGGAVDSRRLRFISQYVKFAELEDITPF